MKAARIPGMAIAIVQDGQIVHTQGFGTADASGRPVTPETPFIIGSTSKSFTAMAIMQLAEAGKLKLDDPVQTYLPSFTLADQAVAAKITVRHLLNQTSGLSTNAAFGVAVDAEASLETYVRELGSVAPTAEPGSTFQYSNANYSTLGAIIEAVSGQSYDAYLEQRIFAPIGMTHASATQAAAEQDGLASGYQYYLGFPVAREIPSKRSDVPAGFINASAADMGHYLLSVMNPQASVLSAASVAEMQRPAVPMGPDEAYAMGWMRRTNATIPVIDHPGDVMNYKAYMAIAPEHGWGVVLLANSNNSFAPDFPRIASGVISLIAGLEPPAAAGLSTNQILLGVGILLILILLWQISALVRVKRWSARLQGAKVRPWLLITSNLVLGLLIWLGIPAAMQFSWATLLEFAPDMAILIAAMGTLSLLVGALRLVVRLRSARA